MTDDVLAGEGEAPLRVSTLELFFDLVFVFALTQITSLMADDPTVLGVTRGLLIFLLVWFAWSCYSWLGNQARADEGVLRVAVVVAMTAMFLVSITIPNVWASLDEGLIDPLVFAVFYVIVRVVHLATYAVAAGDDRGLRMQLVRAAGPVAVASVLLLVGSLQEPAVQMALWTAALDVDYAGIYFGGTEWRLPAPAHFAERHGLVVIIALGESIVAVGLSVSDVPLTWSIVLASALAMVIAVCLWWLYFDVVAIVAEHVLAGLTGRERAGLARDSYTYLHVPIVAGIIVFALGAKKALSYVADAEHYGPWKDLPIVPTTALYGGVVLYLVGHIAFRWRNVHSVNRRRAFVAVLLAVLIPFATHLPVIGTVSLLAAVLVALVTYEAVRFSDARHEVRHGDHAHHIAHTDDADEDSLAP